MKQLCSAVNPAKADTWAPTNSAVYQLCKFQVTPPQQMIGSIPFGKDCFCFFFVDIFVQFHGSSTTFWVTDNNVVSTDFFQNLWAVYQESTCIFKVAVLSSNFLVWTFAAARTAVKSTAGAAYLLQQGLMKEVLMQRLQRMLLLLLIFVHFPVTSDKWFTWHFTYLFFILFTIILSYYKELANLTLIFKIFKR